ncbi:MAG: hypothetical protein ACHQ53_14525 [Polyangiales bacterium]
MNLLAIDVKRLLLLASALFVALIAGCSTPAVGAPCLPEQVPQTGFDDREAYIETSSVQCQTRVCMVYRLRGDPRQGCVATGPSAAPAATGTGGTAAAAAAAAGTTQGKVCASPQEVLDRIYCTCRCNAGGTGFAECKCPDGYTCVDVLDQGGPGVRGGYCVKNGTFTNTTSH